MEIAYNNRKSQIGLSLNYRSALIAYSSIGAIIVYHPQQAVGYKLQIEAIIVYHPHPAAAGGLPIIPLSLFIIIYNDGDK
jgi:hypothetical protein